MSEYQFYEFEAIDRPLTEEEQQAVSSLSSRVDPHPYRAEFTYHYSDLPARPQQLVADYYDAMFYIANWGTTQLMFRFPKKLVDIKTWREYCTDETVTLTVYEEHVILNIISQEEEGFGWLDEESYLGYLIPLRQNLLDGDLRLLYLAWLLATTEEYGYDDEEDNSDIIEPPVPSGLKKLTPALRHFVEIFELDEALIDVAAEQSSAAVSTVSAGAIQTAIGQLDRPTVDELLVRLYHNEKGLSTELRQIIKPHLPTSSTSEDQPKHRTLSQLEQLAEERAEHRRQKAQAEAERKRIRRLEELAQREDEVWQEIEQLLTETKARNYDEATKHVKSLQELAQHQDKTEAFQERVYQLAQRYARRKAFIRRLEKANLI